MTATAERRSPAIVEAARRTLERPLASYQLVLGSTALLLGLGLIMVLSASSVYALRNYGNSFAIVERQLIFAVLGVIGAVIAARVPLTFLRKLILPFLLSTVALIAATFVIGVDVNGNRNWLALPGGFQLQPSEFAKLALVLWIADLYARRQKYLSTPRYVLTPMVPIAGAVAALVVGQHDLGTALVLFALIGGMLWVAGLPAKQMSAVVAGIVVILVFFVATAPHRVARLFNFTDPQSDPDSAGFQAIHGMMALARGGFWGVGLGGSRQKWGSLPEAHTDFILAVIGEELGLLGTFVVLTLLLVLAFAGIRIASRTKDPFVRYTAAGITIWIMSQAVINIGMVLGLLPVIGIPLPLISYGGSSLLVTLVAMGVLLNCAKTEPGARRALAAGRASRARGRVSKRS
ncbi:putative lipid II flippase FtsW [Aeromicrobium sp. 9AM]|jgi:cell division protein FtsW|uniref:putative lipid II flippase FtsW n=1 Tax=Aeromicrobium sp. 9AM TaxID=2653126 RepID=UPI0012F33A3E|nr:putative lipid II flippase FtsW [Aeromicrobium sp. 9AM]VXC01821.1 factor for spore cortex peptidoglycan synthesis (stage V sporulation) [Aeromicrobium sp. 9AM]